MTTFQEAYEAADQAESGEVEALDEGTVAEASGQAAGEGTGSEGDEPSYFDLDQYGDQVVKIKVDGVEQTVPLRELPNGYMRQAAFTQKTQALADERARLQAAETLAAAYERNPVETVRFLAQQNGLTFAQAQAAAEAASGEQSESWADEQSDPRYEQLNQRLEAFEAAQARQELEATVTRLGQLYGDDFNANEVISQAIKLGTTDLASVYKQIAFDRYFARQGAEREVAERTATETAQRTQAKADLGATVATGQSFNGAGSTAPAPAKSLREAFDRAADEFGWSER